MGALAKPRHPSAKESVITITVDEFHSKSSSDNGLRLSNGASPTTSSANYHNELELQHADKNQNEKLLTDKKYTLSRSYSEVFMNNDDSYITPGADMILDPNNYDSESGKRVNVHYSIF